MTPATRDSLEGAYAQRPITEVLFVRDRLRLIWFPPFRGLQHRRGVLGCLLKDGLSCDVRQRLAEPKQHLRG